MVIKEFKLSNGDVIQIIEAKNINVTKEVNCQAILLSASGNKYIGHPVASVKQAEVSINEYIQQHDLSIEECR